MDCLEHHHKIKRSTIVCSTGRSGSTLLSKTLKQLQTCGNPEEYFHLSIIEKLNLKANPEEFLPYYDSIIEEGLTDNGTFGIKLHWWHLYNILAIARKLELFHDKSDMEIIHMLFPNPKFIYIWRQNMAEQAISTVIALQTGVWLNSVNKTDKQWADRNVKPSSPSFRPLKIYRWEQKFKDQNRRWRQFFAENSVAHHEVTYEQLANNFSEEITHVSDFLSLDPNSLKALKMPTKRQANKTNEQFKQYYTLFPPMLLRGMSKVFT